MSSYILWEGGLGGWYMPVGHVPVSVDGLYFSLGYTNAVSIRAEGTVGWGGLLIVSEDFCIDRIFLLGGREHIHDHFSDGSMLPIEPLGA